MSRLIVPLFLAPFLTACLVVPEGSTPAVGLGVTASSQFNFRGIPNNEKGVLQGEAVIDLPSKAENSVLSFRAFTNVDLSNDTGDAWFPDGHGGEPTQFDFSVAYTEQYKGYDLTFGLVSYALQNPDDFPLAPSGERGETREVFAEVGRKTVAELYALLALHYDFDESDGWYVNAGLSRQFKVKEDWVANTSLNLGYSDENQSDWNYGVPEAGLADLRASGGLSWFMDLHTTITFALNLSTILDSGIEDWFDQVGLESNNVWASLGVSWSY